MDQKKTGALIRMLRQEKGLTQRQVAQALAVDHRAVSKWEQAWAVPTCRCWALSPDSWASAWTSCCRES